MLFTLSATYLNFVPFPFRHQAFESFLGRMEKQVRRKRGSDGEV